MSNQDKPRFIDAKRRGFLQGAAIAGGAATTAVDTAGDSLEAAAAATDVQNTTDSKGYELTDHVKKYYEKARF